MAAGDTLRRITAQDQFILDSSGNLVGVKSPSANGADLRYDLNAARTTQGRFVGGYTKLIEAALRPANEDVTMASPPTITVGTADAASVIASAVDVNWDDARLTFSTRVVVAGAGFPDNTVCKPAYLDVAATGAAASLGGVYTSFSFITEETQFEVRAKGFTRHRVWVTEEDGIPRCLAEQLMASTGSVYRVLYNFGGSRKPRAIVVQFTSQVGGLSIGPNASITKWAPQTPKLLICGDSFTEGTGGTTQMSGFAPRLAELLGCYATSICCGIGGTGYLANNSGTKKAAPDIVQNSVVDNAPDVVLWMHGLNDGSSVSAAAAACYDAVSAALPDCLQIVFGAFQPRSVASAATRSQEIALVCASRPALWFIDNTSNISYPEITGTGSNGAGTGNSNWAIGADSTHPTADGHKHIAYWRAAAIRRALALR